MADAAASLKLVVDSSGFTKGLKGAESAAASSSAKMGASVSRAMSQAAKGGLKALGGVFSKLKQGFGMLSGLGGGIGFGMLVRSALDAESAFRRLGFAVEGATGKPANVGALRAQLQGLAVDTGIGVEQLIETFDDLLTRTGDLSFVEASMQAIADTALATGAPMSALNEILEATHDQMGVMGDQTGVVLAQMTALAKSSGMSIEELASKFELVSATAAAGGLKGTQGLADTAAMLKIANDAFGGLRKGVAAYTTTMDKLSSQAGRKDIFTKLGVKATPVKGTALDAMREIMKATSGKKELIEKAFAPGATEVRFLVEAGKSYAAAFEATGGSVEEKTAAGVAAFDAAIKAAGTSARSAADIEEQAEKAKREAANQIAAGIEKLKVAFTQPAITDAMTRLAGQLPRLADGMARVIEWIASNPLKAAALGGGAVFAKGAAEATLGAMIAKAFAGGGATAATALEGGIVKGGASAAGNISGAVVIAGAGIAAAVAQGIALARELKTHKSDVGGLNEDLMRNAERQGENVAFRETDAYERFRGAPRTKRLTRNVQTGAVEESSTYDESMTIDERYAAERAKTRAAAVAAAAPTMSTLPAVAGGYAGAAGGSVDPATVGRTMAEQLLGRSLKVEISPSSIAALATANKAGPPGPTKPGSVDH